MSDRMSLESIAKMVLKLIAFILILLVIFLVLRATKPSLFNIFSNNITETKITTTTTNENPPFYSEFIKNYRECKLSPSVECFCEITYPDTGDNYVLELENYQDKKTNIKLYLNAQLDDCGDRNLINPLKDYKQISPVTISGDRLFFRNEGGELSVPGAVFEYKEEFEETGHSRPVKIKSGVKTYGALDITEFAPITEEPPSWPSSLWYAPPKLHDTASIFIYQKSLCSSFDYAGGNEISLKDGAYIYKFDRENTAVISPVYGIKKCDYVKESIPAEDEFNKMFSTIKDCDYTKTLFCEHVLNIPKDFSIKLETVSLPSKSLDDTEYAGVDIKLDDSKIVMLMSLYYKNTRIKYNEISKNLCQYTHFESTKNNPTPLSSLVLGNTDYREILIYPFSDKICILPFNNDLLQQWEIAQARASTTPPIVPQ